MNNLKLGIIRCRQTEEFCPGTTDFNFIREKQGAFSNVEGTIEIIGFISCGGCPGKNTASRALEMVNRGATGIAFASCIQNGNPIGYPCPFAKKMKEIVINTIGEDIEIFDYTH